jgi:hypothetical protein
VLVFSHRISGAQIASEGFVGDADALSSSGDITAATHKFSRLAELENFRYTEGRFLFRLVYPLRTGDNQNVWFQTSNPATDTPGNPVTDYKVVNVTLTGRPGSGGALWAGLRRTYTDDGFNTFIDGSNTACCTWFAIGWRGAPTEWAGVSGFLGVAELATETWVQLYVTIWAPPPPSPPLPPSPLPPSPQPPPSPSPPPWQGALCTFDEAHRIQANLHGTIDSGTAFSAQPVLDTGSAATKYTISATDGVTYDGTALAFDGVSGAVSLGTTRFGGSAFSMSMWVKYAVLNNWSRVFDFGSAPNVANTGLGNQATTNTIEFGICGTWAVVTPATWTLNTWMHFSVACTPPSTCTVYINGAAQSWLATPTLTDQTFSYASGFGKSVYLTSFFAGSISDFRFFNRALTSSEVTALYTGVACAPPPSPPSPPSPPPPQPAVAAWLARVQAAGGDVSTAQLDAHVKFYAALQRAELLGKIVRLNTFSGTNLDAALVPLFSGGGYDVEERSPGFAAQYGETTGVTQSDGYLVRRGGLARPLRSCALTASFAPRRAEHGPAHQPPGHAGSKLSAVPDAVRPGPAHGLLPACADSWADVEHGPHDGRVPPLDLQQNLPGHGRHQHIWLGQHDHVNAHRLHQHGPAPGHRLAESHAPLPKRVHLQRPGLRLPGQQHAVRLAGGPVCGAGQRDWRVRRGDADVRPGQGRAAWRLLHRQGADCG